MKKPIDNTPKLNIWIVADDVTPFYFPRRLRQNGTKEESKWVTSHLTLSYFNLPLKKLLGVPGTPDIIIIDCGMISLQNKEDRTYQVLTAFAKQHTSSIICISSAFLIHARATIKDLKGLIENDVVVEELEGGMTNTANYIFGKVLKYYPRA